MNMNGLNYLIAAEYRPYVKEYVPYACTSLYVHNSTVKFDSPSLLYACTSMYVHSNTVKFDSPFPVLLILLLGEVGGGVSSSPLLWNSANHQGK